MTWPALALWMAVIPCAMAMDESVAGDENRFSVPGVLEGRREIGSGCGYLVWNSDSSLETAYAWRSDGVVPPYYGAWAEVYSVEGKLCTAVFGFTDTGTHSNQLMDVYVWDDSEGIPGSVLCLRRDVDPGPVGRWPVISYHAVPLDQCCMAQQRWWVGFWGNWPGELQGWLIGADLDGPGSTPKTNIAPGIGFPTGWQNVSVAFGPTEALAIGAEIVECQPTPAKHSTWGTVKALYSSRH